MDAAVRLGCGATHRAVAAMGHWLLRGEDGDVGPFVADMLGSGMDIRSGVDPVGGIVVGFRIAREPEARVDYLDGFEPVRRRTRLHGLGSTDEVATWVDAMASLVLEGGHRIEFGRPGHLVKAPVALAAMQVNAELLHLSETIGADFRKEDPMFLLCGEGEVARVATVVGDHVSDPVTVPRLVLEGMWTPLRRELSRDLPWSSTRIVKAERFAEVLATHARVPRRVASPVAKVLPFARARPVEGGTA